MIVGAVSLGHRSTLDTRAGVGGNTCLEEEAYLTACLIGRRRRIPRGELWMACQRGRRCIAIAASLLKDSESDTALARDSHGCGAPRAADRYRHFLMLPPTLLALIYQVDEERALRWLSSPSLDARCLAQRS